MDESDLGVIVKMRLANKVVTLFLFLLIFIIGALVFSRFYVSRDYWLHSEKDCDPASEACFVRTCEEDCDEEETVTYYKLQHVEAKYIPICDPHETECPEIDCSAIPSCIEEYCDETNLPDGESCNDPEVYSVQLEEEENGSLSEVPTSDEEQEVIPSDTNE